MNIYDEDFNLIDEYDENLGRLISGQRTIVCNWVIDIPEQKELRVVAEYANGGKDTKFIVTQEEVGHWDIRNYATNEPITTIDASHYDSFSKAEPIIDIEQYQVYHPYSEDEIAELAVAQAEYEKNAAFQDSLMETISAQDAAICELYELLIGE